ncbi:hypothetical protein DDW05_00570 [Candidatus Nanobsidianus stetteri]|uniref:Uncharacterized protein n=1 Tax=Nanobsidianus stetteri TaxID=1294122 RepID=A0A2T9WUS2_NANST|nr:hypothetical protein DDW05_00570 [Candidatus Nanobsidianus stetteri]
MKKIYLLSFILFSLYSIFSQGYNIWHSTSLYQPVTFLSINLSDNKLSVGQTLYYNVYINYRDIYYIPNASLVIQIIQKNDNNNIYPFQFTSDNEVYEYVIKNIYLQPGESLNIPLNYTIPDNLPSGYYYIVAYLYTPLSEINGLPFIYYPGAYQEFYVNNPNNVPEIYIIKNDAYLSSPALYTWGTVLSSSGYYYSSLNGPSGYGVSNYINLTVGVYSSINTNATLNILISPWDDILYNPVYNYTENIQLNEGYNIINIPYINVATLNPNAYSLKITLLYNNQTESIYRLRFIVLGPTTRLDGVYLQGNGNLTFIVAPSPDHYTYPVTPNVVAEVYSNTLGFNENIQLGNISWNSTQFTYVNLQLPLNSTSFDLCINLYSNNNLNYAYCTYYIINQSNTYGIPINNLIYVNYTNNYFYICSNISGILNIGYNSESNIIYTTNINNNCLNYTLSSGVYYISFYSSQYSNLWIINNTIQNITTNQTYPSAVQNHYNYFNNYLYLVVILIIIIAIILFMMKKKKVFIFALLLLPILFNIHSQGLYLSTNQICTPSDSLNITTQGFNGTVTVSYEFYNPSNPLQIFAIGNYSYLGNITPVYNYTVYFSNLPLNLPNNINSATVDYNITVQNCTVSGKNLQLLSCDQYNYTGFIYLNYPYYFEYYTNSIYQGADDAGQIIPGCPSSNNLLNNTYFNFTVILPNGTTVVTRTNCPGSGDPDWGQNLCDLNIINYDTNAGNYTYYGEYYYDNTSFNQSFIDNPLQVLVAIPGEFTTQSCSHAITITNINSSSNPLSIYFSYYGPYSGTYYTYYNGIYVLAQNTSVGFNVSGGYDKLCSDGATWTASATAAAWLYSSNQYYNPSSFQYVQGMSNLPFNFTQYNIDRNDVYNVYPNEGILLNGSPPILSYFTLYNFSNNVGYYVIYQDYIKTRCTDPANYICDANGTLCNIGYIAGQAEGWLPIYPEPGYYLLVINPNATVYLQNLTYYPYIYNTNPGDAIYIGNITNVGIGNLTVNVNWTLPNDPNSTFLLQQQQYSPLYIYFPTNLCPHYDCTINYSVTYQNAYGLTVYSPVTYYGYVNINWDTLNIYTNPSLTQITYGQPSNITIAVQNTGPVPAENISVQNIYYNSSCIQILNTGSQINSLNPNQIGYLNVEINVTNLYCSPQDYNITFTIYGWNTYIYNYSIILPISYIISPPNGAQLQSLTTFNIVDKNAQTCYIVFNGAQFSRNCNSDFEYQQYMCAGSLCNTQIQSINNYAEFYENYIYYNYLTNQSSIMGIAVATNVISLYVGQEYKYPVLIKNLVPSDIQCSLVPTPSTTNDKATVTNYSINGIVTNNFVIGPYGSAELDINILGASSGVSSLVYGIICNSTYGSSSFSTQVPIYVLGPNNVIANYTQSQIIVSEKVSPTDLIGIGGLIVGLLALFNII